MSKSNTLERAISRLKEARLHGTTPALKHRLDGERNQTDEFVLERLAKESSLRDAISESCRVWVKAHAWPALGPDGELFLYNRISYAFALAQLIRDAGFQWEEKTESDLLIWLLIGGWETIGSLLWKWDLEKHKFGSLPSN